MPLHNRDGVLQWSAGDSPVRVNYSLKGTRLTLSLDSADNFPALLAFTSRLYRMCENEEDRRRAYFSVTHRAEKHEIYVDSTARSCLNIWSTQRGIEQFLEIAKEQGFDLAASPTNESSMKARI
jgi:hypothetical protein